MARKSAVAQSKPKNVSASSLPPLSSLSSLSLLFSSFSSEPERFFTPAPALLEEIRGKMKTLYDLVQKRTAQHEEGGDSLSSPVLPELLISGFSSGQIFSQLQMARQKEKEKLGKLEEIIKQQLAADNSSESDASSVARSEADEAALELALDENIKMREKREKKFSENPEEWEEEEEQEEEEEEEEDDDEEESSSSPVPASSVVDEDAFFSLAEMEKFADEFENEKPKTRQNSGDSSESEDFDLGVDVEVGEDVGDLRYQQFFDPPNNKQKAGQSIQAGLQEEDAESYGSDDEDEWGGMLKSFAKVQREKERKAEALKADEVESQLVAGLSSYERQRHEKAKEIAELEKKIMQPRDWTLQGEKLARDRPMDSLLETPLEYEKATREDEAITESVAEELEAIVKRRILSGSFNDPMPRLLSSGEKEFKYREELSAEKPEVGLADQYEAEIREADNLAQGKQSKLEEQKSREHAEISQLFAHLCYQLDALANFQFKPKPPRLDLKVDAKEHSNTKAIALEDATPAAVSDAQMLAPGEIYRPQAKTGIAVSTQEASREEKQRKRAHQKENFQKRQQSKDEAEANRQRWQRQALGEPDKVVDENSGGVGQQFNRIGGRKRIGNAEIERATTARNVRRAPSSDSGQAVQYNKSADFFALINQVEADARKEKKQSNKGNS